VATVVESNTSPHSAKGRLVVSNVDFTWCRALMTWKKRYDPCWPRERYLVAFEQEVDCHLIILLTKSLAHCEIKNKRTGRGALL